MHFRIITQTIWSRKMTELQETQPQWLVNHRDRLVRIMTKPPLTELQSKAQQKALQRQRNKARKVLNKNGVTFYVLNGGRA
jgi:hypothetical protein